MARTAIHPGEHLAEQLEALGMSAAELGRNLKVPTNHITGILSGRRAITGDTALRLGHFFGTSPEFWRTFRKLLSCAWPKTGPGQPSKVCPQSARQERNRGAVYNRS